MLKEAVFNSLGGAAKLFVSFISVPVLLHYMGTEHYGIWILLFSFTSILTLFDGGIGLSVVYYLSNVMPKNVNYELSIFSKYLSSLILVIISLNVILIIFYLIFKNSIILYFTSRVNNIIDFKIVLLLLLFSSVFLILQQFIYGILQASLDYKYLNLHKSLSSIIQQFCIIALVMSGESFLGMSLIVFMTNLIFLIISFLYIKKYIPKGFFWAFDLQNIKEIFRYSSKVWVGYFGSSMFSQADKFIAASCLSLNNVGIYGAITSILAYINMASSTPIRSLITHAALSKVDNSTITNKFGNSLDLNLVVAFCASLFLITYIFHLNLIEHTFFGHLVISLTLCIYFIYSINASGYFYLLGTGKVSLTTRLVIIGGISSLVLIFILGKFYGLYGCLLGNFGYIITLYLTIYSKKELNLKLNLVKIITIDTCLIMVQALFIYFNKTYFLQWISATILIFISFRINHSKTFSNILILTKNVITR